MNGAPIHRCCLVLAALFIAALLAASGARAQAAPALDCQHPAADLDGALTQEPFCKRNAAFMHHLGRLLIDANRFSDATDRLEAAIMLEPERWSAHLDYALALDAAGDRLSAAGLLRELDHNPAVTPSIRVLSRRLLAPQLSSPQLPQRTIIGLSSGYDDNLLGVTRFSGFDLTLPSGRLPVLIAPSQLQQGGRYLRLDLSHEADLSRDADSRWRYGAYGSQRWSVDYSPADLAQAALQVERLPMREVGAYGVGLMQQVNRGGDPAVRQWQLGSGVEWTNAFTGTACRSRVGGEIQQTLYPGDSLFDGNYAGALAYLSCPEQLLQVQLRAGDDRPRDADRPGGVQRQYSLRVSRQMLVGNGVLAAEFGYYRQLDRDGYSPLLEYDAPRKISRSYYQLEYRWAFGELSPYVGFEWIEQNANLELFTTRNRIFTVGIRQLW